MKKINKILLLINLFFLQIYLFRFEIFSLPSNLQEVLIGLQCLTFLFTIIREKQFKKTFKNLQNHWVILSFLILTIVSIIMVPIFELKDFLSHGKFLFFALILSFIFLESFKSEKEKEKGIIYLAYGAFSFGLFSLIYNLSGFNVTHDYRLLGPLDSAVYLAYYLSPFFIFFSIKFFENLKNKKFLSLAIGLGLLILATRSMGAIGANFLVILAFLFLKFKDQILKSKFKKTILIVISITLLVVIFYSKILPAIQTKWSSLDERGEIWKTSIHLLSKPDNLLSGLGFGQFQYHYEKTVATVLGRPPLDYYVLQPHNIFILFTSQFGILGLLFIIICIYLTFQNIKNHKKEKLNIGLISSFILIYFFIHGQIDTPIFKNDLLFILILFLELAIPTKKLFQPRD